MPCIYVNIHAMMMGSGVISAEKKESPIDARNIKPGVIACNGTSIAARINHNMIQALSVPIARHAWVFVLY